MSGMSEMGCHPDVEPGLDALFYTAHACPAVGCSFVSYLFALLCRKNSVLPAVPVQGRKSPFCGPLSLPLLLLLPLRLLLIVLIVLAAVDLLVAFKCPHYFLSLLSLIVLFCPRWSSFARSKLVVIEPCDLTNHHRSYTVVHAWRAVDVRKLSN